jgi:hypothetical protein
MDERASMWRIAGEPGDGDAVRTALSRSHATLWYGPHCLTFSCTRDVAGNFLLRLAAVGRLLPVGFESPVLVLIDDGDAAQQVIAPDDECEGANVLRLGRALFTEVAQSLDHEAAWR